MSEIKIRLLHLGAPAARPIRCQSVGLAVKGDETDKHFVRGFVDPAYTD